VGSRNIGEGLDEKKGQAQTQVLRKKKVGKNTRHLQEKEHAKGGGGGKVMFETKRWTNIQSKRKTGPKYLANGAQKQKETGGGTV